MECNLNYSIWVKRKAKTNKCACSDNREGTWNKIWFDWLNWFQASGICLLYRNTEIRSALLFLESFGNSLFLISSLIAKFHLLSQNSIFYCHDQKQVFNPNIQKWRLGFTHEVAMFLFRLCCLEANKQEKNTSKLEQTFHVTATVTNIGNFLCFYHLQILVMLLFKESHQKKNRLWQVTG